MNFRMIGQVVGRVLCIEAALMLLPMIAAVIYDESPVPFLITIGITGGIGLVMWRVRAKSGGITARDGFLIVGLSWIAMSLLGAIPFVLTGDIPNYIDALFETISGLTTTGASVVTSPESMTRGGMVWRLFTHWIGGMGILVFVLAVLPMSGNRSMHIMRAEVPGPTVGKLVPRIRIAACLDTLSYLARGGRIPKAAADLGKLVNLKPLVAISPEGRVAMAGKAIGRHRAGDALIKLIKASPVDPRYPILPLYTAGRENCIAFLRQAAQAGYACSIEEAVSIGPTIGSHVGPGAFGVAYISA